MERLAPLEASPADLEIHVTLDDAGKRLSFVLHSPTGKVGYT